MGHHVPGDESPFLKRVLIPLWVVRIIIMVVDVGTLGLYIGALVAWENSNPDDDHRGYRSKTYVNVAIAMVSVILVIILVCLVLDIVCIIKRSRRTLTPRFFLIVNVIQTTSWTIKFVMAFIGLFSILSIILSLIVYFSFIGLLVYASIIFHRHRRGTLRGSYARTSNEVPSEQQILGEDHRYGVPAAQGYSQQNYPRSSHENRSMESYEMAPHASGV